MSKWATSEADRNFRGPAQAWHDIPFIGAPVFDNANSNAAKTLRERANHAATTGEEMHSTRSILAPMKAQSRTAASLSLQSQIAASSSGNLTPKAQAPSQRSRAQRLEARSRRNDPEVQDRPAVFDVSQIDSSQRGKIATGASSRASEPQSTGSAPMEPSSSTHADTGSGPRAVTTTHSLWSMRPPDVSSIPSSPTMQSVPRSQSGQYAIQRALSSSRPRSELWGERPRICSYFEVTIGNKVDISICGGDYDQEQEQRIANGGGMFLGAG